jgi:Fe2+ transport system protein FeoA
VSIGVLAVEANGCLIRDSDNDSQIQEGDDMKLVEALPGQAFIITDIADDFARLQAIRFGIAEGARAVCQTVLPGGPVVVRKGKQEMALGRNLADRIEVRPVEG